MSCSSLLFEHLAGRACSALSTLPRSGRIAWVRRSRPCLAEPPAVSPSTMNSSESLGIGATAVGELAGQVQPVADRASCASPAGAAARLASRARAARMMRADDRLGDRLVVVEPLLERGADHASTGRLTSGLFSRSLVWPWNCGSRT